MVYFCHQFHPYAFISLLVDLLLKFNSIDVVKVYLCHSFHQYEQLHLHGQYIIFIHQYLFLCPITCDEFCL